MIFTRKKSLAECAAGDVVGFSYGGKNTSQGLLRRQGTVVEDSGYSQASDQLSSTKASNKIQRSRFLVTVEDGPEQYRQFYAEDVAARAIRFTWLGKILNKYTRKVGNATGSWL